MPETAPNRPTLARTMTGAELQRWYWLKEELANFARALGIRSTGGKEVLTERIAAHLDGRPFREAPSRAAATKQLAPPLAASTVIPVGQRCSQIVRAWFAVQLGAPFSFDGKMRDFFAQSDGTQTLGDALEYWHGTRSTSVKPIDAQFEYNRFTRGWHAEHPAGTKTELLQAWQRYRSTPIDERGRV